MISTNSFQKWIGLTYVDDVHQTQCTNDPTNTNIIKHSEFPTGTRVINKDSMITMDFNPERINVHIDDDCIITKVRLG